MGPKSGDREAFRLHSRPLSWAPSPIRSRGRSSEERHLSLGCLGFAWEESSEVVGRDTGTIWPLSHLSLSVLWVEVIKRTHFAMSEGALLASCYSA